MFIDDRGNKFKIEKEIKDFARKDFYEQDKCDLFDTIGWYVTTSELLKWIFENDKEKFLKDYKNVLKKAEDDYAHDYFIIHDIEEM